MRRSASVNSWTNFLGGAAAALLLLPIPAYATLTWGRFNTTSTGNTHGNTQWTSDGGTPSDPSDTLIITPVAGSGNGTFTFTATVTQGSNTSDTVTPSISGLNTFTLGRGETLTWQVSARSTSFLTTVSGSPSYTSGNQFSGPGTGPSAIETGQSPISAKTDNFFGINGSLSVSVTFTFSGTGSWSVASTPVTVVFNGT